MEFLKNHYEKVVLSVVLLGLAVVVAFLPSKMPGGEEPAAGARGGKMKPLDLTTNEAPIKRLEQLQTVVWYGEHNLFNPVQWRRYKDMSLQKIVNANDVGPGALRILRIAPLFFRITFEQVASPKYQFTVMQQANKNVNARGPVPVYAVAGEKTDTFKVLGYKGSAENPTEIALELNDQKNVVVSKDKPYEAVAGYTADLMYPHEARPPWMDRRVGDRLIFDGDTNNIVDISSNQVVISASSGKRTKISYKAAP